MVNLISRGKKTKKKVKSISYSQLKNWMKCPHLHWLISIAKLIDYEDNIWNLYGDPVHQTLELLVLEDYLKDQQTDYFSFFKSKYINAVKKFHEEGSDKKMEDDKFVEIFEKQADAFKRHLPNILPTFKQKFGEDYKLIELEKRVYIDLDYETDEYLFCFNGYIDVIVQDASGRYHIIDWKTCTKLWNNYRKRDASYYNQLLLYRHFLAKDMDINPENIDVHYFFLPTTEEEEMEVYSPSYSDEQTEEALSELNKMVRNAFEVKNYTKKATCKYCDCKKYYKSLKEQGE